MTADAVGHAFSVAVITPYCGEPLEVLARCHASVRGQAVHYMVADGRPSREIDDWDVEHIKLPRAHCDYGVTPRVIGAISAASQGIQAIVFLDADNCIEPTHVQTMMNRRNQIDASIVTGTRTLYSVAGKRLGICTESDGENFNDMNCYLVTRKAFPLILSWLFSDDQDMALADRIFWRRAKEGGYACAHCTEPTINYTTDLAAHYLMLGLTPPAGAMVYARKPGSRFVEKHSYEDYLGWRQ